MAWPTTGNFTAWNSRCKVTVPAKAATPEFWPLFGSDMPAEFWDQVDASGDDIRIAEADEETAVPGYVASLDTMTELACICIGGEQDMTSETEWYVYWNNVAASAPAVTDPEGRNAVFGGYSGAWINGLTDLTGGGITLTANNSPTQTAGNAEGILAYSLNGTNQYLSTTSPPVTGVPAQIEVWDYTTASTVEGCAATLGNSASSGANLMSYYVRGNIANDPTQTLIYGGGGTGASVLSNNHPFGSWNHVGLSRNAVNPGSSILNRNGTVVTSTATIGTSPTYNRFLLGALQWGGVNTYWTGLIGPAFLSSTIRSTDYLAVSKASWEIGFYTVGAYEAGFAGTTGWIKLQSVSESGSDVAWTNLSNAADTDSNFAYVDLDDGELGKLVRLYNPAYPEAIPSGASDFLVTLRLKFGVEAASGRFVETTALYARKASGQVGDNIVTSVAPGVQTVDYESTGYAWTAADFDSNMGLDLQTECFSTPGQLRQFDLYLGWANISWMEEEEEATDYSKFFAMYR